MFEQLQLFAVEDDFFLSSTKNVRSNKVSSTQFVEDSQHLINKRLDRVEDTHTNVSSTASISTYRPNGRKTEYYRLVYRNGVAVKAIHIRGGNVNSALAINRAKQLQAMINRGASVRELLDLVNSYCSL